MRRGRGQGHRGPVTKGPRRHKRTREGEQTGGRTGPRSQGKEGALPRELLRNVLVLAGGQRGRENRAGQGACHDGTKERAWGGSSKVPHRRASRPLCAVAMDKAGRRGALPRRGPPRVESHDEGQVRACDVHATCLRSVLRSKLRGDEGGKGGAGREGPEANLRRACDMPTKCPARGQQVRIERGKGRGGRGRQGGRRGPRAAVQTEPENQGAAR